MSSIGKYAKAIVAIVGSLATWALATYPPDSQVAQWASLASAIVTAVAVFTVPNAKPADELAAAKKVATTVGTVSVKIVPDASDFIAKLIAAFNAGGLPTFTVGPSLSGTHAGFPAPSDTGSHVVAGSGSGPDPVVDVAPVAVDPAPADPVVAAPVPPDAPPAPDTTVVPPAEVASAPVVDDVPPLVGT